MSFSLTTRKHTLGKLNSISVGISHFHLQFVPVHPPNTATLCYRTVQGPSHVPKFLPLLHPNWYSFVSHFSSYTSRNPMFRNRCGFDRIVIQFHTNVFRSQVERRRTLTIFIKYMATHCPWQKLRYFCALVGAVTLLAPIH